MPENVEVPMYIWQDPEDRWANTVINHVKIEDHDLITLHFAKSLNGSYGMPIEKYMLDLCYEFSLLENERTTLLSYKDHLLALELCMSRLKTKSGETENEINSQDVIECHNAHISKCLHLEDISEDKKIFLDSYEEFLKHSNCTDLWSLYSVLHSGVISSSKLQNRVFSEQYLLIGVPESEISLHFAKLLAAKRKIQKVIVETSLNASFECSPSSNSEKTVHIYEQSFPIDDLLVKKGFYLVAGSATEEYAEEIILAFLSLVVNCRNELALSKAMISPVINLSHSAFTEVKRLSLEKEMPMCQTVISYVTRIKLGGKGYAPPANCPLLCHLKALEQFVNLLNQCQTIIEEDNSGSAVKRVINALRRRLLKSNDDKLKNSGIEDAAKNLIEIFSDICKYNSVSIKKTSVQVGQESFDAIHQLVNYKAYSYKSASPEAIMEQKNSQRTPLNLPPLLGYFRSPDEDSCVSEDTQASIQSLKIVQLDTTSVQDVAPVISYFHSSESNTASKPGIDSKSSFGTTFKGCLSSENSTPKKSAQSKNELTERRPLTLISNKSKVSTKRSLLGNVPNPVPSKKVKPKKEPTKKPPKAKVQIKGQGQITSFFIKKS